VCQCALSSIVLALSLARLIARRLTWDGMTDGSRLVCHQQTTKNLFKPLGYSPAGRLLPTHAQVVANMNSVDTRDISVVRICAKFESLLARFDADCELVESVEFLNEEVPGVEEARARKQSTIHQWQSVLHQIGQLAAHTNFGAFAKILVLQCCLEHGLAADENLTALVQSLARDLDRIMRNGAHCPCRLHPIALPADLVCD